MTRITYSPDDLHGEVVAPSGYYEPVAEESLEYEGRKVLYVLGNACIDASCCGVGSWSYARVEGFLVDRTGDVADDDVSTFEVDTVESERDRVAISRMLEKKHPGARIEFR